MNLKNPKDYQSSIKFSLIILITLLVSYGIPRLIIGSISIYLNVAELGSPLGVGVNFLFGIGALVELILMGPVFIIIFYIIFKYLLSKIEVNQGRNKYYLYILEILAVFIITILSMGHVTHILFNYANHLYRVAYGGYDTTQLFLLLYYSDEWLGHHLIHIAFFGIIILALIADLLIEKDEKMSWDEIGLTVFMGIGFFIINGYATYEGQCATLLVILSLILLVSELVIISWKKLNPLQYPVLSATLISTIISIIFFIVWIGIFGWKPYYPFYFQPSEL